VESKVKSAVHEYDADFYRFLASFAAGSAEQIVPLLTAALVINSVADFGCGQGAWLSVWRKTGAVVMGVDGPYVDRRHLMIDQHDFRSADLSERIDLGRRFDLVQSLEVAEHIPSEKASDFVEMLTDHAPLVMFSAAVPGQGGEHHINEQPLEYWREMFGNRGYVAIDFIRPQLVNDREVQDWYRYNIILYSEKTHILELPDCVRAFHVPEDQRLPNYWPLQDRIRHAVIRQMPRIAVDFLSRLKTRLEAKKMISAGL
jgi:SAM-dependent methyltransferase